MNPWKVSAQFAAFVWFLNRKRERPAGEASRFARNNWIAFLPYADEGTGKLLLAMSKPRVTNRRKAHPVFMMDKPQNRRAAAAN